MAIRAEPHPRGRARCSTGGSAVPSSTSPTADSAHGCSSSSTGPTCSSRAGGPASPNVSASGTKCCIVATRRWCTARSPASARRPASRRPRPRSTRPRTRRDDGRAGRASATDRSSRHCPFASIGRAYLALIGTLAALYRREDDGVGRHVETSLLDGALAYLSMLWGESDATPGGTDLTRGRTPPRHPLVPVLPTTSTSACTPARSARSVG